MRLQSIKLQNIRSYLNQTIEFPEGSLLLVGDIGSGKSTTLLAIEFGLFGIMHGTLSGNALLRNGKNEGSVELKFYVDNQEVIIKRVLKRAKDKVVQQSGYIIKNGLKREATPVELKSEILDLLGYPKELLTKSKNLIFRYTVYTPQEEMKQIMQEENEYRLDTLRRVFGIDKYKRIRENSSVYIRELREKAKLFEGRIFDLEDCQKRQKEHKEMLRQVVQKIKEMEPGIDKIKREVAEQQKTVAELEKQLKEAKEVQHGLEIQNTMLNNKIEQRQRIGTELAELQDQLKEFESEPKPKESLDSLQKLKIQKEPELSKKESLLKEQSGKIQRLAAELDSSISLQEKIGSMQQCPVCLQEVGQQHKKGIHEREQQRIEGLKKKTSALRLEEAKSKQELESAKQGLEELKQLIHKHELFELKQKNLEEKRDKARDLQELQEKLKKEIGGINAKKLELQEQLKKFEDVSAKFEQARDALEQLAAKEKSMAVELARVEKERESVQHQLELIEKELNQKLETKKQLQLVKRMRHWTEAFFLNLMAVMEKQVMARVYSEFNEHFQQWFNTLIEEEGLNVRLDDEFSPVIEQNGYEVEFENLSGGEKTSCALAYRLALNKVINDVMSTIKTRELIILDEPTDGFSTEQLDRLRDVLDQLNIAQIIIVSHESQIEGYVSNVLRVGKEEHVSSVV